MIYSKNGELTMTQKKSKIGRNGYKIIPCPKCEKNKWSYYFHTKLTLLNCMNRDCPSNQHYAFVTYNHNDPKFGEFKDKLATWHQYGIKDNEFIEYEEYLKDEAEELIGMLFEDDIIYCHINFKDSDCPGCFYPNPKLPGKLVCNECGIILPIKEVKKQNE